VDRLRVCKAAAGIDHDDALGRDDEAGRHMIEIIRTFSA
jgi:hypothetical protein